MTLLMVTVYGMFTMADMCMCVSVWPVCVCHMAGGWSQTAFSGDIKLHFLSLFGAKWIFSGSLNNNHYQAQIMQKDSLGFHYMECQNIFVC